MMIVVVLMVQCNNDDDLYLNSAILQGTWVEVEPLDMRLEGDNYTFTFKQDSFYLKIRSWKDIVDPNDTCGGCHDYIYARGFYLLESDTIRFNGTWCTDSNYCKNAATMYLNSYKAKFNYEMRSRNEFILNPQYEEEYFSIRLVKEK